MMPENVATNTVDKQQFYIVWLSAWLFLDLVGLKIDHLVHPVLPFPDLAPLALRDQEFRLAEGMFALFPVAWTIALLWARNPKRFQRFLSPFALCPFITGISTLFEGIDRFAGRPPARYLSIFDRGAAAPDERRDAGWFHPIVCCAREIRKQPATSSRAVKTHECTLKTRKSSISSGESPGLPSRFCSPRSSNRHTAQRLLDGIWNVGLPCSRWPGPSPSSGHGTVSAFG